MHKISLIHAFIACSPVRYKCLRFQVLDVCLLGMEQYKNLDLSLLSRKAKPFNLILTRGKHVWCLTDVHYKDSCSLKSFLIMTCHHPQDHFKSKDAIQWKTQINLIHKGKHRLISSIKNLLIQMFRVWYDAEAKSLLLRFSLGVGFSYPSTNSNYHNLWRDFTGDIFVVLSTFFCKTLG